MGVLHATRRVLAPVGLALIVIARSSGLAAASYPIAAIDAVRVSYDGDDAVQFVEIERKAAGSSSSTAPS